MFDFLKRHLQKQSAAMESTADTYRRLVKKAAADGDLKDLDTAKLAEAAAALGVPLTGETGSAEADISTVNDWNKLQPVAAGLETAEAKERDAIAARNAYDRETETLRQKFEAERGAEYARLDGITKEADAAARKAKAAQNKMAALEQIAWRVFGHLDPAKVAADAAEQAEKTKNHVYLCHAFRDAHLSNKEFTLETVVINAAALDNLRNNGKEIVKAPWQTDVEFAALNATLQKLARGARYLRRRSGGTYRELIDHPSRYAVTFEDLTAREGATDPATLNLLPWPESDPADFATMKGELQSLHNAWKKKVYGAAV